MRIPSGTTDQYCYFFAVDATDFTTPETGLSSFTVYRARNGGAAAAFTTPTVAEVDATNMAGVYSLLLDEDMTIDAGDDEQEMVFHISHAGMAPVVRTITLFRPKATVGETITVSSGKVTVPDTQKVDVETIKTQTVTCGAGVTVLASVGTAATSTAQTGDSYAIVNGDHGNVSIQDDIDTLLTRIVGTLLAGNHTAQSGDGYAVVAHTDYGNAKLVRSTTPANALTVDATGKVAVPDTQKVDVNTIKTQAVTCGAGVTVLASVGTAATSTAQTGDTFGRLGAPAGASVSADVAAIKTDTGNLVTRITATLFTGITSLAQWLGLLAGKQVGDATARTELRATGAGSGTFDETTDSTQAIRDTAPLGTAMRGTDDAALAATALSNTTWTDAKAGYLDEAISAAKTLTAAYDAAKTAAAAGAAMALTPSERTTLAAALEAAIINELDGVAVMQAIADLIASDMTTTDLTVAAIAAATRDAILNRVLAGNHDTASTTGKLLQYLDAAITSRHASGAAVAKSPATLDWSADVSNKPTIGTSTLTEANVRTAVGLAAANLDTQLADIPTVAEFNARTLVAASYFDPAADTVANVTTVASLTNAPADMATASNQTTMLNRLGAFTGSGVNTVLGFFKSLLSKTATLPTDVGGTFDPATDSTEAIRDRGDVAWITATGTSTITAADIENIVIETGVTLKQALQRVGAVAAGKVSGAGTGTEVFVGLDGLTTRVTVTVDSSGNRSAITYA